MTMNEDEGTTAMPTDLCVPRDEAVGTILQKGTRGQRTIVITGIESPILDPLIMGGKARWNPHADLAVILQPWDGNFCLTAAEGI